MDQFGESKYMPIVEIHKKLRKNFGDNVELDRLKEILQYYENLSVVSLDTEGRVIKV